MKTKKDWTDALREQCFPEEVSPSEGSWAGISGRMHRRSVRRTTVMAVAAILVPVSGAILCSTSPVETDTVTRMERPDVGQTSDLLSLQVEEPAGIVLQNELFRPAQIPLRVYLPQGEIIPDAIPCSEDATATDTITEPATTAPVARTPVTTEPVATDHGLSDACQVFPDEKEPSATRKGRLSVNIHASGASGRMESDKIAAYPTGTGMESKASESDFYNMVSIVEQVPVHYRHDIPISLGIALRWNLSSRVSVESGLTYSYLHSYENLYGDQKLHFAGIPLRLNVQLFSAGPWEVGAGGYGMAEKCLSATQGRLSVKEPDIQWSSGVFLDAGYRLVESVSLYIQPSMSCYLTKTKLLTYRTENPLGFFLQAGLRFNLQ